MIEKRVYCDVCGTELTDEFPGETYTAVPVQYAAKRHHSESGPETKEYHLCEDEVPVTEFRGTRFFKAGDVVPMMLEVRYGCDYVARPEFDEPYDQIADALESVFGDG